MQAQDCPLEQVVVSCCINSPTQGAPLVWLCTLQGDLKIPTESVKLTIVGLGAIREGGGNAEQLQVRFGPWLAAC